MRTITIEFLNSRSSINTQTGCIEWSRGKQSQGYGYVWTGKRNEYVHRLVWTLLHGPIPDGLEICHTCDNKACLNPDHLFLGTHLDNMRDMANKGHGHGYGKPGEANGNHKLTQEQVNQIRERHEKGETLISLGHAFKVHYSNIGYIVNGLTWSTPGQLGSLPPGSLDDATRHGE